MERETINYKTEQEWLEARKQDITSSEVSALFGLNKYMTAFELWHLKKENIESNFKEHDYVTWGKRLEASIAQGVAEDNDWVVEPFKSYVRLPELNIGSSFDFEVYKSPEGLEVMPPINVGILEIKNVNQFIFAEEWDKDDDGNVSEAPTHIEMQLQHQLLVSGHSFGIIAALINGNKLVLLERKADKEIHDSILEKCAEFWKSIKDNKEPKPDLEKDVKTIARLYGYAEPGKIYEADENAEMLDLVKLYYTLGQSSKANEAKRKEIKSKILLEIGDAEKVINPMFSISTGMVKPTDVSYHRDGYRMFKINPKKVLKEMI